MLSTKLPRQFTAMPTLDALLPSASDALADLIGKHQVTEELPTGDIPNHDVLARVLADNSWSFHRDDDGASLGVGGVRVRYYEYPSEDYSLEVRRQIIRNMLVEFRTTLGGKYHEIFDHQLCGCEEGLRKVVSVFELSKSRPDFSVIENSHDLVRVLYHRAGRELLKYFDALLDESSTLSPRQLEQLVYVPVLEKLAYAHQLATLSGFEIFGRGASESYHAERKMACNMKLVGDLDYDIERVITAWYGKLALVKAEIINSVLQLDRQTGHGRFQSVGTADYDFVARCLDLVDTRRNEPEYEPVLKEVMDLSGHLAAHLSSRFLDDIVWLTVVREPLRYGDFSGAD